VTGRYLSKDTIHPQSGALAKALDLGIDRCNFVQMLLFYN
jgi:hypothetical protein